MEFRYEELVENEMIIGRLLVQGLTVKAIAAASGLSKRVVSIHIRNMKVKLQANDLAALRHSLRGISGTRVAH